MTTQVADLTEFVQRWVSTQGLTYVYVESSEGRERVNKAFDRLFAEMMRRRREMKTEGISNS